MGTRIASRAVAGRRRWRLVVAGAAAAGLVGSGAGWAWLGGVGATAADTLDGTFTITSVGSGKVLSVPDVTSGDRAQVVQETAAGRRDQQWSLSALGDGSYVVRNAASGKVLDVYGARTDNGAPAILYRDWGGANQHWRFVPREGGSYELVSVNSGKALDVSYRSRAERAQVWQWAYVGGANQKWTLSPVGATSAPSPSGSTSPVPSPSPSPSAPSPSPTSPTAPRERSGKALIAFPAQPPTPQQVRSNTANWQTLPLDGLVMRPSAGVTLFSHTAHSDAQYDADVAALTGSRFGSMTDNFLRLDTTPESGWNWMDDGDWAAARRNLQNAARLISAGHLRGILLDPEQYNGAQSVWAYGSASTRGATSFAQASDKVRERGRDMMSILLSQDVDVNVAWMYIAGWLPGLANGNPGYQELQNRLSSSSYGLQLSLVAGMLEAIPAGDVAKHVTDAAETTYFENQPASFRRDRDISLNVMPAFVPPQDRAGYTAHVGYGDMVYLDGLDNQYNSPRFAGYYLRDDAERRQLLEHDTYQTLSTTDRWTFVYTESKDLLHPGEVPGSYLDALASARQKVRSGQPLGFALSDSIQRELAEAQNHNEYVKAPAGP